MPKITDTRILILATDGFEQSELETPLHDLREKGATVHVATPGGAAITGWDKANWGNKVEADKDLKDVRAEDYDGLVLPGGQINPDILRTKPEAVQLVKDFVDQGRIVAAICHGPWMLVEADVVKGREMTSYPSIKTDLKNAGADWVDREIAIDNGIITSRNPGDLPAFVGKIVEEVEEGKHSRRAA
ncbi:protease I [Rhodovulum sp. ES.010]|uniref:type 1 glutamine amidotransferase domain-containing protein n=1 Tax=Rhodovulum sp. ES.010 TaxID=1882821 RepID=UPI00092C5625|nr:type 1 glutamine amidotransferase domain-containing protein [Rhodovulum sp. ES.010]SIO22473.1 protease I [Rhodovulum sp. ES.010]